MVVKRNFEELYRTEKDPWQIGGADSERYHVYLQALERERPAQKFASAIDLGCGKGAFSARLTEVARRVTGVEISEIAVAKARTAYPALTFLRGDARRLGELGLPEKGFDLVVSSDLIAYLSPREAEGFLREVGRILAPGGRFFLAAWSPGGRYYTPESLEQLLGRRFAVMRGFTLPSGHAAFVARHRHRDLVLSVDYETWQPIPKGKRIDWGETVLRPAERLMLAAERFGAPITFFVEMGEILWLRLHDPCVAEALENQIRDARRRGHDIQLHLHPEWLPTSSPRHDPLTDGWWWDEGKSRLHLLEEDPSALIGRLKEDLEAIVRPVDPAYKVRVFRAGKYRIQPHGPVLRALAARGIPADSSVWHGGRSFEDRFDFRGAFSALNPYFPSPIDINLPAPPAEASTLEFPISSRGGGRFTLEGADADQLLGAFDAAFRQDPLSRFKERHPTAWRRMASQLRRLPGVGRLPRLNLEPAPEFNLRGDDTVVAIGHTKGDLRYEEIEALLATLQGRREVRFRTFSQVVQDRLAEREASRETPAEILRHQVEREREAVLGEERNEAQSAHLQEKIPLDRRRILDLGCGAGYWTRRLADRHGFCAGVDFGVEFLRKARSIHQVPVLQGDFHHLPLPDRCFDTVYADNVLEHSADPGRLLAEIHRVLDRRGLLVAAVPPDARNPRFPVSDHLWKTDRADLEARLTKAGFSRARVEEVDTARAFGMSPYPASGSAMFYVTAWKNEDGEYTDRERAADLMDFVYRRLNPSVSQSSLDAEEILRVGFAWCLGYCAVLGEMARREGIPARFVTLEAEEHPRGRGARRLDTHELVELRIGGRWIAFDAMANRILEGSAEELLADPALADRAAASRLPDERFRGRGYHLYCSSFFYQRVVRYCRRGSLTSGEPWHWVRVRRDGLSSRKSARPVLRLILTDSREEDARPAADVDREREVRIWTRSDLASLPPRALLSRVRRMKEDTFEILSEDLQWHERVLRLHLLGALCPAKEKWLLDRKGRRERLGWWPLISRQLPAFLTEVARAARILPRLRVELAALSVAARMEPSVPPMRRPLSLVYLRSDLWRGLKAGGSVGHIAGTVEAFRRTGYRVSFLAADPPAGIDRERMPVFEVPPPRLLRVSRAAARFAHSFGLARAGVDLFGTDPPGFIYHRFDEGSIAGVLLSRALSVPLVLEYNGSGVWIADHWDRPLPHRGTFEAIERINLRHAHLVVTVSRVLKEELMEKGVEPRRVLVCPNGVDPGTFRPDRDGTPVRHRLGLEGKTVIGFIGTFGPWHGGQVLAVAAGEVARRHPSSAFLFIGDGPGMKAVRDLLRGQGIEDRCRFAGLVPQQEAPDYLAACDLFTSPHVPNPDGSRFFGSPTKLFEYLAMGKGIVASDLEQIGEVLEEGRTALLVPPGDSQALAEALSRLVADPDLRRRLGSAGREAAVRRHTWDRNALAVLDLVRFL